MKVTLDLTRRLCLTQGDLGLRKLAVEEVRGAAVDCRLKRVDPSDEFAKNIGHRVTSLLSRDTLTRKDWR